MNWLAHLLLSAPHPDDRLGHVLADLLTLPEQAAAPKASQDGMRHHRAIDAFTDGHLLVRQAISRLPSPWRRYGGVLTDLYFDHLLARDFHRLAGVPLHEFTQEVYAGWAGRRLVPGWGEGLPARVHGVMQAMAMHDLLGSYREPRGVAQALSRMGARLRRPVPLHDALPVMQALDDGLSGDFESFWPQLRSSLDAKAWSARQERVAEGQAEGLGQGPQERLQKGPHEGPHDGPAADQA